MSKWLLTAIKIYFAVFGVVAVIATGQIVRACRLDAARPPRVVTECERATEARSSICYRAENAEGDLSGNSTVREIREANKLALQCVLAKANEKEVCK